MKEQTPDVSIIVPCYNAKRYLGACLESLHAQKQPEIEMILIDDGSTDETASMLDAFAAQETRARVVHTENGGVSAARNKGLAMACGRYIAFMDADDLLEDGALLALYRQAEKTGAQIVAANHTVLNMEKDLRSPVIADPAPEQPVQIAREIIHMHRIYNNLWNKLYDRTLFDGLQLDESVKIGEDAVLNLQLYLRADTASHVQACTYVYRVHQSSAMAGVKGYAKAHQPMLKAMCRALSCAGVREVYFKDFLQTCVWMEEKERGIRACMKTFNQQTRPLALEGAEEGRIPKADAALYRMVKNGHFPAFYMLMRIREKLGGRRWGIRR